MTMNIIYEKTYVNTMLLHTELITYAYIRVYIDFKNCLLILIINYYFTEELNKIIVR